VVECVTVIRSPTGGAKAESNNQDLHLVKNSTIFLYMSINLKNREAEALLAELKAATGKGASQIILELLRKEAARQRRQTQLEERREKIRVLAERYSARLPSDTAPPDEIIGYDENGLPV
jgi:antitoxin VapB